jgi:hypothetical protein
LVVVAATPNDRIAQLEKALEDATNLLQHERAQHAQRLSQEKERHANSMQAVQLRLYISETRLKTYQDALDEHIQSVASNVCCHPSNTQSPPRGRMHAPVDDSPRLTSPLISRVILQNNQQRLEQSTTSTTTT